MAQDHEDRRPLLYEGAAEAPDFDPTGSDSKWFLPAIGLGLLCMYLMGLNVQTWSRLEAVCEVAMSKDALSLCLQYGAR